MRLRNSKSNPRSRVRRIGKAALGLVLLVTLAGLVYGWQIYGQLKGTLRTAQVREPYHLQFDWVRARYAKIPTRWRVACRVFATATDAPNWIVTERHGLVSAVVQWSPERNRWVQEPCETLPIEQRVRLRAIQLIKERPGGG